MFRTYQVFAQPMIARGCGRLIGIASLASTVGLLEVHREIPLAASSVQGVAIDSSFPREIMSSAVKVVRPGGRIVGPAGMEPLEGLELLARDPSYWVAEKPAEMIPLRRSKPV